MSYLNPQNNDFLPREVGNHSRMGLRQMWIGNDPGGFVVEAEIPENTWQSVGPTGSGADNIWPAMDVIPPNAQAIIIRCEGEVDGPGGGTKAQGFVYARKTGTSMGNSRYTNLVRVVLDNTTGGQGDNNIVSENVIPLDANNRFDMRWSGLNETDFDADIEYAGFICEQIDPLEAPVVLSVDSNLSVCNVQGGPGWKDCVTLGGGEVDESAVQSNYTHYAPGTSAGDTSPPTFPGAAWTAYTQSGGDLNLEWDQFGSENGPLDQPPAAGPYIGASPWNDAENVAVLDGGGGGQWFRIEVTISNAAGSDTFEIFYQTDCF